jgi:hypothetical protein
VRELTYASVVHPEYLDGQMLVTHPTLDPLTQGAPDLGWEGDARLAVYLNTETQRFTLYRLEVDSEYRGVAVLPPGGEITPANVNRLCTRLVETDQRRGFDAVADIADAQATYRRDAEREQRASIESFGDKFHYALSRAHLPGVDIQRVRNVTSRR